MIGTSIISMISWLTADSSADWNFATLMTINDYSGFEGFLYSTLLSLALVLPIIVGNVILFATTWPLAANLERHHSQTSMELHMMFKMTFFQVFNTVFTAFLFLAVVKDRTCEEQASRTGVNMTDGNMTNVDPTSDCGTMQTFKRQWYELGGQLIVNNMFGDFIAMHLLLDFAGFPIDIVPMLLRAKLPFCCGSKRLAKWNINEWFAKRILPKLAHTQMAMDRLYIIRRDLYLAFRMQFAGKFVVICLMFSSAIPFLYLVGTAYFWLALWVDRYNLLRHVAPPPRTGPSLTVAMATFWFPLSIVLHLGLAIVFFIQHEGPQGSRVFSNHTAVETADRWAPPHTHARIAPRPRATPLLGSLHTRNRYFSRMVDRGQYDDLPLYSPPAAGRRLAPLSLDLTPSSLLPSQQLAESSPRAVARSGDHDLRRLALRPLPSHCLLPPRRPPPWVVVGLGGNAAEAPRDHASHPAGRRRRRAGPPRGAVGAAGGGVPPAAHDEPAAGVGRRDDTPLPLRLL